MKFWGSLAWSGGVGLAALAVVWGQLWLLLVGYGIIGGIGLGLAYVSPVSTLIKWFPDNKVLAPPRLSAPEKHHD